MGILAASFEAVIPLATPNAPITTLQGSTKMSRQKRTFAFVFSLI
jgi:hypothetical protein